MCRVFNEDKRIISEKNDDLETHSTSVLCSGESGNFEADPNVFKAGADWLIHGEKSRISKYTLIRDITLVPSIDVILFAGKVNLPDLPTANEHEDIVFKIDDFIQCIVDESEARLLFHLRSKFASMFWRFLSNHKSFILTNDEEGVLDVMIGVVQQEDAVEKNVKFNRAITLNENQ